MQQCILGREEDTNLGKNKFYGTVDEYFFTYQIISLTEVLLLIKNIRLFIYIYNDKG